MFSVLLDPLPDSYLGILIRTDFRIGIQISSMLSEVEGDEGSEEYTEVLLNCLSLLYGKFIPDWEIALDGLRWFMRGGKRDPSAFIKTRDKDGANEDIIEDEPEDEDEDDNKIFKSKQNGSSVAFDYYFDSDKIFTAFLKTYNMDLNTCEMHWFKFLAMLEDLGECLLSKAIEYRTTNLSQYKGKQLQHYRKMRKRFAIPMRLTEDYVRQLNAIGLDYDDVEMYMQY